MLTEEERRRRQRKKPPTLPQPPRQDDAPVDQFRPTDRERQRRRRLQQGVQAGGTTHTSRRRTPPEGEKKPPGTLMDRGSKAPYTLKSPAPAPAPALQSLPSGPTSITPPLQSFSPQSAQGPQSLPVQSQATPPLQSYPEQPLTLPLQPPAPPKGTTTGVDQVTAGGEKLPPTFPIVRNPQRAALSRGEIPQPETPVYAPSILEGLKQDLGLAPDTSGLYKGRGAEAARMTGLADTYQQPPAATLPETSPQAAEAARLQGLADTYQESKSKDTEAARLEGLAGAFEQGTVPPAMENIPGGPVAEANNIPWSVLGFGSHDEGFAWATGFKEKFGVWPWEGPGSPESNLGSNLANYYTGGEGDAGPQMLSLTPGEPLMVPQAEVPAGGEMYGGFGGGGGGFGWYGGGGGGGGYSQGSRKAYWPWMGRGI